MDPVTALVVKYVQARIMKWLMTTGVSLLIGAMIVVPLMLGSLIAASDDASGTTPTSCDPAPPGPTPPGSGKLNVTSDKEARKDATIMIARSIRAGVGQRGALIAIMTSAQETGGTLHNIDHGDRDSLGLFQQRPSTGWGTPAEVMNPVKSSDAFLGVASHTHNPGLTDIRGWRSMPPGTAAQAVQASAFPTAYAKWQTSAQMVVSTLWATAKASSWAKGSGSSGDPSDPPANPGECDPVGSSSVGAAMVKYATSALGTPYVWGGGDQNGPTRGSDGVGTAGYDCSGLTLWSVFQATQGRVLLPHGARLQRTTDILTKVPGVTPKNYRKKLQPGDVIVFNIPNSTDGVWGHVGIYAGGGELIHAPHPGAVVEVTPLVKSFGNAEWAVRRVEATKATTG